MEHFWHFVHQFANYPSLSQKSLDLKDKAKDNREAFPRPSNPRSGTDSRLNIHPRSDEERDKMRGPPRGPPRHRGPSGLHPPQASSPHRRERRPRRNSESSMVDKGSLDPNEERRRRERRKERDERAKNGKEAVPKRVRRPQGLDLIDKLDVTGIYGPSMIHHDGPYDAVQPHRNRKKDQRAPMHAFPANSANNSLGGSGPVNSKIDLDRIHGRGAEGFTDYGGAENHWKKSRPEVEFNAKGREDIVHGEQSHGLGTSTFLEGAPASRKAIEEDFDRQKTMTENGLGRKKSIAQRIRGIQPRRTLDSPRITSAEARYSPGLGTNGPWSAGLTAQTKANEKNPFFTDEYEKAYDAKGAAIKTTESDTKELPATPNGATSSTRPTTTDDVQTSEATNPGEPRPSGGFLNRVKSLKGGRRRPAQA